MSYAVDIYSGRDRIARGTVGLDGMIADVKPVDGKGLAYGRHLQFTVMEGQHVGQTVTGLVMGDEGGRLTLKEPMPFK
jgi:hypothetical protein